MKKATFILLFLIGTHVFLFAQKKLDMDYTEIKKYVTEQRSGFDALLQRYESNDSLLTEKEYATIYYGYSFTTSYNSSMDDFSDIDALIKK